MENLGPVALSLSGTLFTFACTAAGAAVVFFFRKKIDQKVHKSFLGFAAGIMIAASVWSLLLPAISMAAEQGVLEWIPAAGGFALGALFLFALDKLLPHMHTDFKSEGPRSNMRRTTLLVMAVTLHNIPEGLAVGLAFGLAATNGDPVSMSAAMALALGIGLQNFPEGAAISLPLRQEGLSLKKSFAYGALSGAVEPIAGIAGALLIVSLPALMPWLLAFAAGAMLYVVVAELIPEAHLGEHSHIATAGVMIGFVLMMILDVALG